MGRQVFSVRMAPTALTAGKTLIQIKAGNSPLEILWADIFQATSTAPTDSEFLECQVLRKSAAATVTSATPLKLDPANSTSLAVGGTSATGTNASAEGTDGDIIVSDSWNIMTGSWTYLPVPEDRIWIPSSGIVALKISTSSFTSYSIGAVVHFAEYI